MPRKLQHARNDVTETPHQPSSRPIHELSSMHTCNLTALHESTSLHVYAYDCALLPVPPLNAHAKQNSKLRMHQLHLFLIVACAETLKKSEVRRAAPTLTLSACAKQKTCLRRPHSISVPMPYNSNHKHVGPHMAWHREIIQLDSQAPA